MRRFSACCQHVSGPCDCTITFTTTGTMTEPADDDGTTMRRSWFENYLMTVVGMIGIGLLVILGYTEYRFLSRSPTAYSIQTYNQPNEDTSQIRWDFSSTKQTNRPHCSRQTNIAYIKTHTLGSSVITNILQRYGEQLNLNFVLPKQLPKESFENEVIGWPDAFNELHIEQMGAAPYNILCNHARYSAAMRQIMPSDTKYITVLSDPALQLYTMFQRLQLGQEAYGLSFSDFVYQYDMVVSRYRGSLPIEVLTKNSQAFDLGLPSSQSNISDITKSVMQTAAKLDLVLITEHMNESLVLLSRELCWPIEYILYLPVRLWIPESYKKLTKDMIRKMHSHSDVDWELYKYFNHTLWKKIQKYGSSFHEDLQKLKQKIDEVANNCVEFTHVDDKNTNKDTLSPGETKNIHYKLKRTASGYADSECLQLALSNRAFTDRIRRLQQIKEDTS